MKTYQIFNKTSGAHLGNYGALTAFDAYLAMMVAAGYEGKDEQGRPLDSIPEDINVVEVTAGGGQGYADGVKASLRVMEALVSMSQLPHEEKAKIMNLATQILLS